MIGSQTKMKLSSRVNKLPEYMIANRKQHKVHLAQLKISWQANIYFLSILSRLPIK